MAVFAREIGQLYKAERLRSRELELALAAARETYVSTMKSLRQVVAAEEARARAHMELAQAEVLAFVRRVESGQLAGPDVAYGDFLDELGGGGARELARLRAVPLV